MNLIDKCKKVFKYPNAIKRKYNNKQVTVCKNKDDSFCIEILNYDKENALYPCVSHDTVRGCVRVSTIQVSKETLEAIIINAIELYTLCSDSPV